MRHPFHLHLPRPGPGPGPAKATPPPDPSDGPGRLGNMLAPDEFDDTWGDHARFDGTCATVMRLDRYPDSAYPGWLEAATTQQEDIDIVVHVEPMETTVAEGHLMRDQGRLEGARYHEEDKGGAVADTNRTRVIERISRLRQRLARDERVFAVTTYIVHYARTRGLLEERVSAMEKALGRCHAGTTRLLLDVARGLRCTFPSAEVRGDYGEPLSGESVMTLALFGTPSFTMEDGYWLGINRCDGSFVIHDPFGRRPDGRRVFENFNGIIGAKSGGGKTQTIKTFTFRALELDIDIVQLDFESEYEWMAREIGGQIIRLSPSSPHSINPLDIPHGTGDRADLTEKDDIAGDTRDAFANHIQTVQSFLDILLGEERDGRPIGLTKTEQSMLDDALIATYEEFGITADPATHDKRRDEMPVMADLRLTLERLYPGCDLAVRMKRFATGGLVGLFGSHTTVDETVGYTVIGLRDLHKDFWPAAMSLVSTWVWGLAYRDRTRNRLFIADEMQKLSRHPAGSAIIMSFAEGGRKYGYGIVGATQDIAALAGTEAGRSLLVNASWKLLMKQEPAGANALVEEDIISAEQGGYLEGCDQGQGVFIAQDPAVRQYQQVVPIYIQPSNHMQPYLSSDHADVGVAEHARAAHPVGA